MRIALDATYSVEPLPSGVTVYCREILSGLAATHPDVAFLHCYRPKQLRLASPPAFPNVRRRLLQSLFPIVRTDLFHALNQRLDSRPARRTITTFHDLFVMTGEYSTPEFRSRFTNHARRAAANSDLIIAVSEFTANQVSSLLNFDRRRIRVVPHGVHPPPPDASSKRENLILFVGALQVRKNILRLVEAFEQTPSDWRLVLAGSPTGFGAAEILNRIETSRQRERISVAGYISNQELERLYCRASIFAFPSLDEGFGIPVLEAMAHGIPVVTSNRSGLPEVAGDAALLVDPRDTEHIQDALLRLVEDEGLRARLAHLGILRAREFNWGRSVEETFAAYKEVAG